MKLSKRLNLINNLLFIGVLCQIGVAYSIFSFVQLGDPVDMDFSTNVGSVINLNDSIKISKNKCLVIGEYFFNESNRHSETGTLVYNLDIIPSLLPERYKIVDTENTCFEFEMHGILGFSSSAVTLFDDNKYLISATYDKTNISLEYKSDVCTFDFKIKTNSQSDLVETHKLTFKFDNQLVLDYDEKFNGSYFLLSVGGK